MTVTGIGRARPARVRPSTTPGRLRRLRWWLAAGTVAALAAALVAFEGAHLNATQVSGHGAPAVLDVLDVQQALVTANDDAAGSFTAPGEAGLTGAGTAYQNQLSLASQDLAEVTAVNNAGGDGLARIQSVDGQLTAYADAIEQAVKYYGDGEQALGTSADWQASQLLDSAGGLLTSLRALQEAEQGAVDVRTSGFWAGPLLVALWAVPTLLLLACLIAAQSYLATKFRRRVSVPFVSAMVLLFALAGASVTVALAEHHLASAHADLSVVTADRATSVTRLDLSGKEAVNGLIARQCRRPPSSCGSTIATFQRQLGQAEATAPRAVTASAQSRVAADMTEQFTAAGDGYGMPFVIPALVVAAAALVAAGLQSRIDEYR